MVVAAPTLFFREPVLHLQKFVKTSQYLEAGPLIDKIGLSAPTTFNLLRNPWLKWKDPFDFQPLVRNIHLTNDFLSVLQVTGSVTVVRLAYFLDPSMVYVHPLPVVGGNLSELGK